MQRVWTQLNVEHNKKKRLSSDNENLKINKFHWTFIIKKNQSNCIQNNYAEDIKMHVLKIGKSFHVLFYLDCRFAEDWG